MFTVERENAIPHQRVRPSEAVTTQKLSKFSNILAETRRSLQFTLMVIPKRGETENVSIVVPVWQQTPSMRTIRPKCAYIQQTINIRSKQLKEHNQNVTEYSASSQIKQAHAYSSECSRAHSLE